MAVEASSLARQIELASNPPLHYERATDTSRSATDTGNTSTTGQLVLYIVRVPGSRDVFLTTLKPREKVVNAPDVQSSLYYLHVANQDANDSRTCVGERVVNAELQRRSWEQRHAAIRPVGQHVKSSSRENLPSMSLAHGSNGNMMTTRKPLPTPPDSPVEDQIGNFDQAPRVRRKAVKISTTSHERYVGRDESDDIALTLIRRDPASGTQWNVATIRNVLPGGCGDSIPVSGIKDEPELEVEVTNPGYSIFATSSGHDQSITPDHDSVFRRRVQNYRLDDTLHSHRGRGYNFVSPWNTRCVFSTGVSGGSLKVSTLWLKFLWLLTGGSAVISQRKTERKHRVLVSCASICRHWGLGCCIAPGQTLLISRMKMSITA